MDVSLVIRRRLKDLGLEQRGLAAAAGITESYVSQLLARKKAPPASQRTDIYEKMESFLRLPRGELARIADIQRKEELKKRLGDNPPAPMFKEFRALILRKSLPQIRSRVRAILEREPFGEVERLITQKLLDVSKDVARNPLFCEKWVRVASRLQKQNQSRVREFLANLVELDVFSASVEDCVPILNSVIDSWKMDLENFSMEVVLNSAIAPGHLKRFEFIERIPQRSNIEPGLKEFLSDSTLSGDVTEEEVEFLQTLNLRGRHPQPIYYYREVQNLRDPVHFRDKAAAELI